MNIALYYDGECPFCNRYADILKLKNCFNIKICDARVDTSYKKYNKDIQLDDGVILIYNKTCYQGVEALDILLSICKYDGVFFKLQKFVFSNKFIGNIIYSFFKVLRKIALCHKNKFKSK